MEAKAIKKIDEPFSASKFIMDYFRDEFVDLWGDEVEAKVEAKITEKVKAEVTEKVKAEVTKKVKAEVSILESEVEQQKKEKINIIRNLISSTSMQPTEIAQIASISVEEVLKIKAEIKDQN